MEDTRRGQCGALSLPQNGLAEMAVGGRFGRYQRRILIELLGENPIIYMPQLYCPNCGPISSTITRTSGGVDLDSLPPGPVPRSKCGRCGRQLYIGTPDIQKYRSSFYSSIFLFCVFDLGILMGWITPRNKYRFVCWIVMAILVYSQRIAARKIGISDRWAVLIAGLFLITFAWVMHFKGY